MLTEKEIETLRKQNQSHKNHNRHRRAVNWAFAKTDMAYKELEKERRKNEEYQKVLRDISYSYSKPRKKYKPTDFEF